MVKANNKIIFRIKGFTIVELLVVIVIIGILTAIAIVSYNGIQQKAIEASIKVDLSNCAKVLEMFKIDNNAFPASTAINSQGSPLICPKPLEGIGYLYQPSIPSLQSYSLDGFTDTMSFTVTDSTTVHASALKWLSVNPGNSHTCAIASNNKAYCWGNNSLSELGNSTTDDSLVPVAVNTSGVLSGKTIKSMSSRNYHTCVIASDNNAYCWGYNSNGQLGNNTYITSSVPVAVVNSGVLSGKSILSISTGENYTCVIASDYNAYCWGNGTSGQLGNNSTAYNTVPVAVDTSGVLSGKKLLSLSAGNNHVCAISTENKLYCWGANSNGQFGNNSTIGSKVPVFVDLVGDLYGKTLKFISAEQNTTCVIASDNQAYCWGYNGAGQLGNYSYNSSTIPVAVYNAGLLSGKTINNLSSAWRHSCLLTSDSQVYCWGLNYNGVIGDGTFGGYAEKTIPTPIKISDLPTGIKFESVSTGSSHSCAISTDRIAYCWGYNSDGQLGNNSIITSPVLILVNEIYK